MTIGILAYCSACNFGAQLQLLSTYKYLDNHGCDPIVIDWLPKDLEDLYSKNCREDVLKLFVQERDRLWRQTRRCNTAVEMSKIIEEYSIDAVVIGSDAVAQHRPLLERLTFPSRQIISFTHPTSDRMFPNPFWGTFNDYLKTPIPIAAMSVSSQDSRYKYFEKEVKREMATYVKRYKYLSVRDEWTAYMFRSILGNNNLPPVTPDPVFGFNQNAYDLVPTKEDIKEKFHLPDDFILVSFHESIVNNSWLKDFCNIAHEHHLCCVNLPYADKEGVGAVDINIKLPITPLEWYALIKYSKGYVGENMHPIVVCLHNEVPFFSFDNYGLKYLNGLMTSAKSSKILHVLKRAKLDINRVSCISKKPHIPQADYVLNRIFDFDYNAAAIFSKEYLSEYNIMMESILKALRS